MKKLIFLTAMFISQLVHAEQCTIVLPQKPGGGADVIVRIMQKYNPEIVVNYKPGAYIMPAIVYADQNPDVGILALPAMYSKNNSEQNPNVEILKIFGSYDHGIITGKNITFNDLLTKKVNIGVSFAGSPAHVIAEQIKSKNPNAEVIPMGGDANALIPLKSGDIDVYITAWPSIDKWSTEQNFKILSKINASNDLVQENVTMTNISRVGIFMSKNATDKQKDNMMKCIDVAFENEEVKREFKRLHLNPLNIVGKEAQKHIQKYIDTLHKYGI